ncbi:MAG TPA: large-conductance mechanosensitive channel protein MscL [Verrucomicrobiae bacterium]|nr:large-conductance mechanosensitive channel protein MscL [Verrucomicrobiae bacterium]
MKNLLNEFKAFAMRGNVVDLAVGVIIGAAFGKIVSSLVNDIIMPPIGLLLGKVDFKNLGVTLRDATKPDGSDAVVIHYGAFLNTIFEFAIVAFCVFLLIKGMNTLIKKQEAAPAAPTPTETLLTEIRDLLKSKS